MGRHSGLSKTGGGRWQSVDSERKGSRCAGEAALRPGGGLGGLPRSWPRQRG